MNIDITEDEIEALRIAKEWGVVESSWAHLHLCDLYDRIEEKLIKTSKK